MNISTFMKLNSPPHQHTQFVTGLAFALFSSGVVAAEEVTIFSSYEADFASVDFSNLGATGGIFTVPYYLQEGDVDPGFGSSFDVDFQIGSLSNGYTWDFIGTSGGLKAGIASGWSTLNPTSQGTVSISGVPLAPEDWVKVEDAVAVGTTGNTTPDDTHLWEENVSLSTWPVADHSGFDATYTITQGEGEGLIHSAYFTIFEGYGTGVNQYSHVTYSTTVPEPSSAMLGLIASGLLVLRRRV